MVHDCSARCPGDVDCKLREEWSVGERISRSRINRAREGELGRIATVDLVLLVDLAIDAPHQEFDHPGSGELVARFVRCGINYVLEFRFIRQKCKRFWLR